jgi:hypothetical protein
MKKALPKISKSLKSFILDEDAKVIDKTATKIAISASFLALSTILNSDDANAKGHSNHSDHSNYLKNSKLTDDGLVNYFDADNTKSFNDRGFAYEFEMTGKSVNALHGNHYNHSDGGGSS